MACGAWSVLMTVLGMGSPRRKMDVEQLDPGGARSLSTVRALHAGDVLEAAYGAQHAGQMGAIADADQKGHADVAVVEIRHLYIFDVGALIGNRAGDGGERPALVGDDESDLAGEVPVDVIRPVHVDPLFRLVAEFGDVLAGLAVDDDAAPGGDVPQDGVAWNGQAALGKAHHRPLRALDDERHGGVVRGRRCGIKARTTMGAMRLASPISSSRASRDLSLVSSSRFFSRFLSTVSSFRWYASSSRLSRRRPSVRASSARRFLREWRMCERALLVTT